MSNMDREGRIAILALQDRCARLEARLADVENHLDDMTGYAPLDDGSPPSCPNCKDRPNPPNGVAEEKK